MGHIDSKTRSQGQIEGKSHCIIQFFFRYFKSRLLHICHMWESVNIYRPEIGNDNTYLLRSTRGRYLGLYSHLVDIPLVTRSGPSVHKGMPDFYHELSSG